MHVPLSPCEILDERGRSRPAGAGHGPGGRLRGAFECRQVDGHQRNLERSGLARVSRTPGRTQLINFFELAPERRLVDLPGYGYAKVPEQVRARWLELMEHYFNMRESLVGLVLIVDSRRGLGEQDATMLEWVLARGRRAHVLLTKSDKLNRRDASRVLKETQAACRDAAVTAQLFSAHAKQGLDGGAVKVDGCALAGRSVEKKKPRWRLRNHRGRPTRHGDDKPGLPAQGEERGASFTLTGLDGGP